ncbi:Hypothetical predicted protein [Pelobates cultripes]|uniref:Uncharacterized protein n=1 Tax=Pelobates cultripes TaxID=61616 RepID=A0AAD1SW70_PELCU|nr:Hypothetical predicted protein [Pelobates cultripes]
MKEQKKRVPTPPEPQLPSTMNSEQRKRRLNYLYMKNCVESSPVVPIQKHWLNSILSHVPASLQQGKDREDLVKELLEEVSHDFEKSMKRHLVKSVLVKPEVKGLEAEDSRPLPESPVGLDFSRPWHQKYIQARNRIKANLHVTHPGLRTILDLGFFTFSKLLVVDLSEYRSKGPVECESLKNNVSLACAKTEEKLLNTWYPKVINLFTNKEALSSIKPDKIDSFYTCLSTLMSNQNIQTAQSWLSGSSTIQRIEAKLPDHVKQWAISKLKEAVQHHLEEPKKHFDTYVESFTWLVDGTASQQVETFLTEKHNFEEYTALIEQFHSLAKSIASLPRWAHFTMIELDCDDLKSGLADKAKSYARFLLEVLTTKHRKENERICTEFEMIKEHALRAPVTTEDVIEAIDFVEQVKTKGLVALKAQIAESKQRMDYLLDVFMFTSEDLALNATVLLWPKKLNPVFDENDELIEKAKRKGESLLTGKREKLMLELEKLSRRMEEFGECSELNMVHQVIA